MELDSQFKSILELAGESTESFDRRHKKERREYPKWCFSRPEEEDGAGCTPAACTFYADCKRVCDKVKSRKYPGLLEETGSRFILYGMQYGNLGDLIADENSFRENLQEETGLEVEQVSVDEFEELTFSPESDDGFDVESLLGDAEDVLVDDSVPLEDEVSEVAITEEKIVEDEPEDFVDLSLDGLDEPEEEVKEEAHVQEEAKEEVATVNISPKANKDVTATAVENIKACCSSPSLVNTIKTEMAAMFQLPPEGVTIELSCTIRPRASGGIVSQPSQTPYVVRDDVVLPIKKDVPTEEAAKTDVSKEVVLETPSEDGPEELSQFLSSFLVGRKKGFRPHVPLNEYKRVHKIKTTAAEWTPVLDACERLSYDERTDIYKLVK